MVKKAFYLCICLFLSFTISNIEAFHSSFSDGFNPNRAKAIIPKRIEQEKEILRALSGSETGSEPAFITDPIPHIQVLAVRLKSLLSEGNTQARRKKGTPVGLVVKERDGTAIFIKKHSFKQLDILKKRSLYRIEPDADFVYDKARNWLRSNADILGMDNPSEELEKMRIWQDGLGIWHVRFKQVFNEIEVFGAQMVVHYDPRGDVFWMSGRYHPTPDILLEDTCAVLTSMEALKKVEDEYSDFTQIETNEKLVCLFDPEGRSHLAWWIHLMRYPLLNRDIFVHARTGKIINRIDRICQIGSPALGSGEDLAGTTRWLNTYQVGQTYYLIDTSKDMFNNDTSIPPYYIDGGIICFDLQHQGLEDLATGGQINFFTSIDNKWDDPYAVSAMYNTSLAYNYFKETFGLESFDGQGRNIYLLIHFGEGYSNAGWDGHFIIIGDGDGKGLDGIPTALDVITHELGHAVVDYKANFVYQGQPGALHEAYADLFGVMCDRDDWTIGEDITISHVAIRDLAQPSRPDLLESLPEHMDDYEDLPMVPQFDYGGVHRNVGIINRATYLIAKSLGRSKTEQIYYRALDVYLTRYSMFVDLKLALVQSAEDLYGQTAKDAIEEAFSMIGIFSNEGSPQPQSAPPQGGEEWILYVSPYDNSLWMVRYDGGKNQCLTYTPVESRPAVTRNGRILFIDRANNIRGIHIDSKDERILSNAGIWKSIAISPNLDSFAVTIKPNQDDLESSQKIYYVSLEDEDEEGTIRQISLNPPVTTQDGKGRIGYIFPGGMDFSFDGEYILFDAYHVLEWDSDHKIEYWEINRLRISDSLVDRPLPSWGFGLDIGHPSFAKGSSHVLAYDLYVKDKDSYRTLITNTRAGKNLIIREGSGLFGSCPSFSADNRKIVYHYFDIDKRFYLRLVSLNEASDGIKEGSDHALISAGKQVEGVLPTWFEFESLSSQTGETDADNGQDLGSIDIDSHGLGLFRKDEGGCFICSLSRK